MNIGNPTRSLALSEAARREYLPVDDKSWSEGVSVQDIELSQTNVYLSLQLPANLCLYHLQLMSILHLLLD
jgi:hypothetical protein